MRNDSKVYHDTVLQFHDRVVEASRQEIDNGEMSVSDIERLLNLFDGAIYMHLLTARPDDSVEDAETLDAYVYQVIDVVLLLTPRHASLPGW